MDLWGNTYRLDDIVDQLLRLVDFFLGVCHNEAVKIFFLVARVSSIRSALALFDGALATNGNLGPGFRLHFLQGVATRTDEQADFEQGEELVLVSSC